MERHKKNWIVKTLDEVCQFQNGFSFKNKDYRNESVDGYVVFRMGNINRGGGLKRDTSTVRISKDQSTKLKRYILNKNDIVMCMTDMKSSMDLLGHTAVVDRDNYYVLNQRVGRITVSREDVLHYRYLFYYTNSETYLLHLRRMAHSGVQVNLSTKAIKESPIFLPPLPTQRKIASILGNYDDLIENNTRRIKILEEMAATIYREWFVEFRFPEHENVKMVESELGLIPQGWEVKCFGDVSLNFDRLRKPLSGQVRSTMQGEYPYYGAASILDHVNDYLFDGRYLLIGEDGSVITKDGRPVLQLVAGKFWANNHTHVVQGKSPISTNFLYLLMSNVTISSYVTGTAQPKINQENLNRIPVVSPPRSLLERFDQIVNPIYDDIVILDRKNINLRNTRDMLLPKLISGEIDVSGFVINVDGIQPRMGGTHIPHPLTQWLHSDEKILSGKPVIKGTRLAVEFIIELLENHWSEEDIRGNYPNITREDIDACRAYQRKVLD
ncbi:MAG: restriction endonuclease subunit S, partial [Candidatus Poribacteria bacterium]|nr:restriction endonuclease subunit S [Candidatus Poribacteria bacterium]